MNKSALEIVILSVALGVSIVVQKYFEIEVYKTFFVLASVGIVFRVIEEAILVFCAIILMICASVVTMFDLHAAQYFIFIEKISVWSYVFAVLALEAVLIQWIKLIFTHKTQSQKNIRKKRSGDRYKTL